MQQTKGSSNITVYNTSGIGYINGDANTDGSIRIVANENNIACVEERAEGVWNKGKFQISGGTLLLGDDIQVGAIGHHLDVYSTSQNQNAIAIAIEYDDTNGSEEIVTPILQPKETNTVTHADFSGVYTGLSYQYVVNVNISYVLTQIRYKTNVVAASSPIIVRAYRGNAIDPVKLIFEKQYPASQFPANSDVGIDVGKLNYKKDEQFLWHLSSATNFSLKTSADGVYPYRAVDRYVMSHARLAYSPAWSEKTWNIGDQIIEGGLIYVCQEGGSQTGSFITNATKWKLLKDILDNVYNQKGGITVANFNALTNGENGDYYRLIDSGVLVGSISANANDTVIIKTNFSSLITVNDYDHFSEPSDIVLQSGRSGGQQVAGGTLDNQNLILKSTEAINKGKILFGNSGYDESNNSLGIGTQSPNNSAILDLSSTSKGFLPPRMTTAQMNLLTHSQGLIIYNTDIQTNMQSDGFVFYQL